MTKEDRSPSAQDRILVRDLLLRGVIGLNDWEREVEQDILINLTLFTDTRRAATTDRAEDILNYRTVTKAIIDLVAGSQPKLVEKLAGDIARLCIRDHGADRAIVRVEKPGALRFAASVGVEIDRRTEDFPA
jgi:FolB domain-containing protein